MVKEEDGDFQCGVCLMWFGERKHAFACEEWCSANGSCNLDLLKYQVQHG